jgi:hypothetical protein
LSKDNQRILLGTTPATHRSHNQSIILEAIQEAGQAEASQEGGASWLTAFRRLEDLNILAEGIGQQCPI